MSESIYNLYGFNDNIVFDIGYFSSLEKAKAFVDNIGRKSEWEVNIGDQKDGLNCCECVCQLTINGNYFEYWGIDEINVDAPESIVSISTKQGIEIIDSVYVGYGGNITLINCPDPHDLGYKEEKSIRIAPSRIPQFITQLLLDGFVEENFGNETVFRSFYRTRTLEFNPIPIASETA